LNNYNQLLILIKTHSPHIISLQETHIQHFHSLPTPINYNILTNIASNRFGGVALLIHKSIQHTQSNINEDVEAIAAEIKSKENFKIYSIYISPNKSFSRHNLNNVININNETVMITGDFNSWHQNWGSTHSNSRGKTIAKYIEQSQVTLLNDKSPTLLNTTPSHTLTSAFVLPLSHQSQPGI